MKIILIVLLVVLGLILLTLGLIMFVPIHYEVSGSIGDSWELRIKGKVTYLLSIIKVLFNYEDSQFGFKLFLFGFEKKMQEESNESPEEVAESLFEAEEVTKEDVTVDEKKDISLTEEQAQQTELPENENTDVLQEESISVKSSKEKALNEKSEDSAASKKKTLKKAKEVKEKGKFNFSFIKQQITDEHNKSVVCKIWSEISYLLKHFRFRKIITDLVFSTGDPASTGQLLGILCMIPTLYQYEFHILLDFESENGYLKGTFLVAGKVRLIHVVITILRLILDKEVRLVFKRIQTLIE